MIKYTYSGMEEAVSHWSGKSFYVASMDKFVCVEATAIGAYLYLGGLGYTDHIL